MPGPDQPTLRALAERRSVPSRLLAEPAPDEAHLAELLQLASRVPDHGALVPWRFVTLRGDARLALGEALAARARERDPQAAEAVVDKARRRFSFAPLVVAVVARLTPDHKVPECEQRMTAGCVCFALLQAARGAGYGAQWLTGWSAYDRPFLARLGLGEHEELAGFIHIGTPTDTPDERERPDAAALTRAWTPD
ncbi:nitroreductase family protein [Coralloluteibacterium stylophorae]|uniref:Putative NAD(P)H nitroreductase n=1 Tax=Coralloluteibacterium stylophorae TaxID=1776034 RepID=A0AAP2CB11_9GAMM|nr:nitroreductase [Coralloluteibacterium stylophorae]MBS7456640.1 nitroreductase [Coralloluteibacterium stylophorae]